MRRNNSWTLALPVGGRDTFISHGRGTVALWTLKKGETPRLIRTCPADEAQMAIHRGKVWFPEELAEAHPAIFQYLRTRDHRGNIRLDSDV